MPHDYEIRPSSRIGTESGTRLEGSTDQEILSDTRSTTWSPAATAQTQSFEQIPTTSNTVSEHASPAPMFTVTVETPPAALVRGTDAIMALIERARSEANTRARRDHEVLRAEYDSFREAANLRQRVDQRALISVQAELNDTQRAFEALMTNLRGSNLVGFEGSDTMVFCAQWADVIARLAREAGVIPSMSPAGNIPVSSVHPEDLSKALTQLLADASGAQQADSVKVDLLQARADLVEERSARQAAEMRVKELEELLGLHHPHR